MTQEELEKEVERLMNVIADVKQIVGDIANYPHKTNWIIDWCAEAQALMNAKAEQPGGSKIWKIWCEEAWNAGASSRALEEHRLAFAATALQEEIAQLKIEFSIAAGELSAKWFTLGFLLGVIATSLLMLQWGFYG